MYSDELVDLVWYRLAHSTELLGLLGIDPDDTATKMVRIQKELEIDTTLIAENVPLITFYLLPGSLEEDNYLVYDNSFFLEVFANSTPDCLSIAKLIRQLLNDKGITRQLDASVECRWIYENTFATGIPNVKGFRQRYVVSHQI